MASWYGYSVNEQLIGEYRGDPLYQRVCEYALSGDNPKIEALYERLEKTGSELRVRFVVKHSGRLLMQSYASDGRLECYNGHGSPTGGFNYYLNGHLYSVLMPGNTPVDGLCASHQISVLEGDTVEIVFSGGWYAFINVYLTYTDIKPCKLYMAYDLLGDRIKSIVEHRAFIKSNGMCIPVPYYINGKFLDVYAMPQAIYYKTTMDFFGTKMYSILRYTKRA